MQKIARRVAAVNQMNWEESKAERVKKFLTYDYTSSDKSELSEDESGGEVKKIKTKRFSWEGTKLRELKDHLDLKYKLNLNPHVRKFQTQRVISGRFSQRGPPPNAPNWAVKSGSSPVATSTPVRVGH